MLGKMCHIKLVHNIYLVHVKICIYVYMCKIYRILNMIIKTNNKCQH